MRRNWMMVRFAVIAMFVIAGLSYGETVVLSPLRVLRVSSFGGESTNDMVAWADGGEYRQIAEFDISDYSDRVGLISATLEFRVQAIWAGGYIMDCNQVPSRLHIDWTDFGKPAISQITSGHWNNNLPGERFAFDVTDQVADALPDAIPNPGAYPWGRGIAFRWSDNSAVQLGYGYVLPDADISLTLEFIDPVVLTPYQQYRIFSGGQVVANKMVAWADGGEYRVCNEFDLSDYRSYPAGSLVYAELTGSYGAIWAGGNTADIDQIASDLHIDSADFGRASMAKVDANHWNNGVFAVDVTEEVAVALPQSSADAGNPIWGQGIQFRFSDNYGSELHGHTVNNVALALYFATPQSCGDDGTVWFAADITGPEGNPDCYVNLLDLAAMASDWLSCTAPGDVTCSGWYNE